MTATEYTHGVAERTRVFARDVDEFLAEYPDSLLEMPDGSFARIAFVSHEDRDADVTAWIVHTAEEPPREILYEQPDDLLVFAPAPPLR